MANKKAVGRKKKAGRKSTSRPITKKSPLALEISDLAGERSNERRSYIKFWHDEETGAVQVDTSDGEDLFYMGARDMDLVNSIIERISGVCARGKQFSDYSVRKTNALLAAIIEIEPQDSTELMLATQMVLVHDSAMEMSYRASSSDQTVEGINLFTNHMTKLMRTYTAQMEALSKYRTKGQQKIIVQHVNVSDGGQAVIGDVNQRGVMSNWRGPPHESIPRCGAKTRSGGFCGHYSMPNGRCRYHGGKSTGANHPVIKHGLYTKKSCAGRKLINELLRSSKMTIESINE